MKLPYSSIPEIPNDESASAVIARFIDGLGFRFRWATEGLTENEFNFRPDPSSMSLFELMEHIYSLALRANNTFGGTKKRNSSLKDFMSMRNETLYIYEDLSRILKNMNDDELKSCTFEYGNPSSTMPFWLMLNGPIADALTHVGQIASWRRIAGNPQMKGVNPLLGLKRNLN